MTNTNPNANLNRHATSSTMIANMQIQKKKFDGSQTLASDSLDSLHGVQLLQEKQLNLFKYPYHA